MSARLSLETLESREVPAVLGTLDTTFGDGGKLVLPGGAAMFLQGPDSISLDAQGRFVVIGLPNSDRTAQPNLLRMNADGSPDARFGTSGATSLPASAIDSGPDAVNHDFTSSPWTVAIDSLGRILVAGHIGWETGNLSVTRFTPSGALDTAYGNGGTTLVSIPAGYTGFTLTGLVVDPAGNATVVEQLNSASAFFAPTALGVVRLTPTGTADPSFNGGAIQIITALPQPYVGAVTEDAQGRVVIVGAEGNIPDLGVFVMRLTTNGALDASFAGTGYVTFDRNTYSGAVATDDAGNVYFGETAQGVIVVGKLSTAGVPDPTFGTGGLYPLPIYTAPNSMFDGYGTLRTIRAQADGHVLVGATIVRPDTGADFAVLRLTSAGTLDPAFNPAGPMPGVNEFDFGSSESEHPRWMDLSPSGQILVGGCDGYFTTPIAKIARLNGDGTGLDRVPIPPIAHDPGPPIPPIAHDPGPIPPIMVAPTNPFAALGVPVRTATGDVDGDGVPDTIFVTGPGTPLQVAVVSGTDGSLLVAPFTPFGKDFTGGGFVAAGAFDGDGRAEFVITPDVGGGPRAVLFSAQDGQAVPRKSFFGIDDDQFRGGIRVAVGDVNGDGTPDLTVSAGVGGGPRVAVFDGRTLLGTPTRLVNDFFALPGDLTNSVSVAAVDVDGDGRADLVFGAGSGGAPRVVTLSGKLLMTDGGRAATDAPLTNFFAGGDTTSRDGARVSTADTDRDGRMEVAVASDVVRIYPAASLAAGEPAATLSFDLVAAAAMGVYVG